MYGSECGVEFVPSLIDFDELRTSAGVEASLPRPAGFNFGCIGRLSPEKNQAVLIEAIQHLCRRGVVANILLIGDGGEAERLRCLALRLGVSERIHFLGSINEIGAVYRSQLDALLVPSLAEAQCRVVAEAQYFGLPVWASTAVPESASLDPDLFHRVDENSPSAWADAMQEQINRPPLPRPRDPGPPPKHRLSIDTGVKEIVAALSGV
jgi:glycosyltransferase involved in cell wall biosynthesis